MKQLIFSLILISHSKGFALSGEQFDSAKSKSARVLTHCLNYKDRTLKQEELGIEIRTSLNTFLRSIKDPETMEGNKGVGVAHADIDTKHTVLIFHRNSGLATSPHSLLRNDERARLEKFVAQWAAQNTTYRQMEFVVRFNDECKTPPPLFRK